MTLTDQILEGVHELAAGRGAPHLLTPLVVTAIQGARAHLQHFEIYAHNPELTADMRQDSEEALLYLLECFEVLQACLEEGRSSSWPECGERIGEALQAVRLQQRKHQQRVEAGPTSHPFVNRLVIHMESWLEGTAPGPSTQALLEGQVQWADHLDAFIDPDDPDEVIEKLEDTADWILQICDDFAEAVRLVNSPHSPPPLDLAEDCSRLIELCRQFDRIIIGHLEQTLSQGPTPVAPVNLLDIVFARYLRSEIGAASLQEAVVRCATLVRQGCDPGSEELHGLLAVLGRISELAGRQERMKLHQERDHLRQAAARLAPLRSAAEVAPAGMSTVLTRLLWTAQDYRRGRCSRAAMRTAILSFGDLISQARSLLEETGQQGEQSLRIQEALFSLGNLEVNLWHYLDSPEWASLDLLHRCMSEADVRLRKIDAVKN